MTQTHDTTADEGGHALSRSSQRPLRRRFRRHAGALVTGAVLALVASPTPALAQPFGPGACGGACYYADNSNETFFYNGLTVGDINAMEVVRTQRLEPTDMTTQLQTSSNNDTDVITYDDSYGANNLAAWWMCDLLVSGSTSLCNRGRIVINLYYGTATYGVACMEVGHGVGLDHSTNTGSCMHDPPSYADYDTHDKGHINGYY
jgi:hypothetical protein